MIDVMRLVKTEEGKCDDVDNVAASAKRGLGAWGRAERLGRSALLGRVACDGVRIIEERSSSSSELSESESRFGNAEGFMAARGAACSEAHGVLVELLKGGAVGVIGPGFG